MSARGSARATSGKSAFCVLEGSHQATGEEREEIIMNKLTTVMVVVGIATAMVLVLVGAPMVVPAAEATNVFCGQTLTQDTKLNGDLTCSGDALRIEADNVTLDLGGFTITGNSGPFPFAGAGVFVGDRTGVTI